MSSQLHNAGRCVISYHTWAARVLHSRVLSSFPHFLVKEWELWHWGRSTALPCTAIYEANWLCIVSCTLPGSGGAQDETDCKDGCFRGFGLYRSTCGQNVYESPHSSKRGGGGTKQFLHTWYVTTVHNWYEHTCKFRTMLLLCCCCCCSVVCCCLLLRPWFGGKIT